MPSEFIDEFEIEYEGEHLPEHEGWGAYVTVYGPSPNPMHRNSIYPTHRVAADHVFATREEAEAQAHQIALSLLAGHRASGGNKIPGTSYTPRP